MSQKKKVLIAYATAGIGHKKAALSVYEALKAGNADLDIKLIDVLDYTSPLFKSAYLGIYLLLIKQLIFVWGLLYYVTDSRMIHFLNLPLRRIFHVLNCPKLVKFLLEYKPDLVLSTHFLLPDICDYVKRKHRINMRVLCVITDYRAHSFWVSPGVDVYIVGHDRVKEELVNKWRISEERVKVMGIPVEPKFSAPHDKAALKRKFNIPEGSFVILLLSGGYGVGPFIRILEILSQADFSLTAITVCGHNKKLYEEVERVKKSPGINVINLAYVDNVDELMAVADLGIGKAGGISSTEAMAMDLPFIFIRVIPGQEKANSDLCENVGACVRIKKINDILDFIADLKSSPYKLKSMKQAIVQIKKPNAAMDIAEYMENLQ